MRGLWVWVLLVASALGQAGDFRIAGKVVSAVDGRVLDRATVAIESVKTRARVATIVTRADGAFLFEHLPAGKYTLLGEAAGFVAANYEGHEGFSTAIVTGAAEVDAEHLLLRLLPAAFVAGRVLDEAGEPVRMAQVTLYREGHGTGKSEIGAVRSETTNDRGEYAMGGLGDGRYFLAVRATPWYATHPQNSGQPNGPQNNSPVVTGVDPSLDVAYPLTFYPDVADWREAAPLELKAGSETRVDVHLAPVRTARLTIRAAAGEQNVGYPQLRVKVFDHYEPVMGQVQNFEGGAEMVGLPPGRYAVQQSDPKTGMALRTSAVDLTSGGMEMNATNGAAVASLKVTVEGEGGAKLGGQLFVVLQGGATADATNAQADDKGVATFERLAAGEYRIHVFGQNRGYPVLRVDVKGKGVSRHLLTVASGEAVEAKVVVAGGPLVSLEGVARRNGKGVAGAMIVLVPVDDTEDAELFRRDQSDLDGTFVLPEVLPGRYIAVAIEDGWRLEWGKAAVLGKYLVKGVAVEVGAGGARTLKLPEPLVVQAR